MQFRSLALLVAVVMALGLAVPAYATSYGSQAYPIKAESNSDDGNAWFYGAITLNQQVELKNHYSFRDSAPGGNYAYVTTEWYFWRGCINDTDCYDKVGDDRSSGTTTGKWVTENDYEDLDPVSDKGRGRTRVCEEQAWEWDDCSKYVTVTLSY